MTHFNRRIQSIVGSTTLAITARAKELKAQGRDVVNFAGGEPDFDTPDFIKQAAIEAIKNGFTKYTPSTGIVELREAICAKFKKDNGLEYSANDVVVSCGAKHSVYNIVQALSEEGDEVIIPAPYWVSYTEMVKLAGATAVVVQTSAENDFKLTADQLRAAITPRTRLLIMNSPSNPTGVMYTKEDLQALADVCVEKNIFVLSDEIYEKLIYDGLTFTSFASLGPKVKDLTITVNGVSKAYSMTGWRIGYAAGPSDIMAQIKKFQDHSTSNPTSISQMAAIAALQAPASSIEEMRATFEKRRNLMMSLVDEVKEIRYIKPQGAFYLFCDFSAMGDTNTVAQDILNNSNVAVIPGDGFGAPGYLRLSFSTSEERIKEGITRIQDWLSKNR